MADEQDDATIYRVVVNHEEQYSIWPADQEPPPGWRDAGKTGPKADCLEYVKEVWADMRPLSLARPWRNPLPRSSQAANETPQRALDDLAIRATAWEPWRASATAIVYAVAVWVPCASVTNLKSAYSSPCPRTSRTGRVLAAKRLVLRCPEARATAQ